MPRKIGIIAGGGAMPSLVAKECMKSGQSPFIAILEGQSSSANYAQLPHATFRIGAVGAIISKLRREGIKDIIFAGHVRKPTLFELQPDAWTAAFIAKSRVFYQGDNSLLSTLITELEKEGFQVHDAEDLIPELLAPAGCLTRTVPTTNNKADIIIGANKALDLGRRDIGQAVVVAGRNVIAEEDVRGTDAMLRGLVDNELAAGGVLVKVVKPGQDHRIDLPSIGTKTISHVSSTKLSGIALSAGTSLIIEKAAVIEAANCAGLFVLGLTNDFLDTPSR